MALIRCTECGHEISDRAPVCPQCGFPIMKNNFCAECGQRLPEGATECPDCGCPIQQDADSYSPQTSHEPSSGNKKKKYALVLVSGALLLILLLGGGYYFYQKNRNSELYSTLNEDKSLVDQNNNVSAGDTIADGQYCYKGDWESDKYGAQPCKLVFEKKDGKLRHCRYTNLKHDSRIKLKGTIQNDTLHFVGTIRGKQLVIDLKITDSGNALVGEGADYANGDKAKLKLTISEDVEDLAANLKSDDSFEAEPEWNMAEIDATQNDAYEDYSGTNEYDNSAVSNAVVVSKGDFGYDNASSSAPQWVQGIWRHDVTAPMVGMVASYTLEVCGNTMTFYRNGEMQYSDNFTYQDGRLVGQHGSFSVNERSHRLADGSGRYDKVGGGGSNRSGSMQFSTSYDVIGYLSGKTYCEASTGGTLQIRQEGCYVNGQCMTGAPRVSNFSSTSAVVRASTIPSGSITFYVDAQNNTITDSFGNKYY